MHGDFSRRSFRHDKHFSAVLSQQGRVSLDADANEQTAIGQHLLRALARDLIGPHGGPEQQLAFEIARIADDAATRITDLEIGYGRYYVDGILIEHEEFGIDGLPVSADAAGVAQPATYFGQPSALFDDDDATDRLTPPFLVYLRVWERHISAIEDPGIREIALGRAGPDTATRAQVIWQVLTTNDWGEFDAPAVNDDLDAARDYVENGWAQWIDAWQSPQRGRLTARGNTGAGVETLCNLSPESRYRGPENQLYRVEIHDPGVAGDGATFKWSRDNGSVTARITHLAGTEVVVDSLGRDVRRRIDIDDWVEVVDDRSTLHRRLDPPAQLEPLHKVEDVDLFDHRLTLDGVLSSPIGQMPHLHPLLRRWDGRADRGVAEIQEDIWLELEDGVQIRFSAGPDGSPQRYRTGDYWLIPARVKTGDVIWPQKAGGEPYSLPPEGIEEHFAPLALVMAVNMTHDLRKKFPEGAGY